MAENLHIAVLTHAIDEFGRGGYVLKAVIDHWTPNGVSFEVARGTEAPPPEADFAISHIDMTSVGDDYARLFENYPLVVNWRMRNISKSLVSDQIVTRDDPYQGPVIVKTDNNFGGMRELRARYLAGDPDATIDIQRPWRKVEFLPAYPVFNAPGDVPPGVWRNRNLIVEKFRPEQDHEGEYVLRQWVFLGDRGVYYQSFSTEPIVKGKNTTRRVILDVADIPEVLREKRESLGFDYGKFDFGIVDGEVVLYDVNRTPTFPPGGTQAGKVRQQYPHMSEGLDYYIRKVRG